MTPDIQELKKQALTRKKLFGDRADRDGILVDHDTILALTEVVEAAKATTANYDRLNPMRTADFHGEECSCFRCSIDRLRTALEGVKK